MVPAKLTLKNFLCYGNDPPPLEFDGIRLACLAGDNGHGKSALLDAMTWALWGEARARDLDSLIHRGERDMHVDFEFHSGGARYRVLRKRSRSGRGSGRSELHFQVQDGDDWKVISGATMHETQRLIGETIKLSYDTFTNSALLLQGRADKFTAATPAQRKEVLAEILGLGQYEVLEAKARDRLRDRARDAALLAAAVAEMEPAIARLPALEREREETAATLAATEAEREARAAEVNGMRHAQQALDRQREARDLAGRERLDAARRLGQIEAEIAALEQSVKADEGLVACEPAIRGGFDQWQSARAAVARWAQALGQVREIERELEPLKRQADAKEHRLRADLEHARAQVEEKEVLAGRAAALTVEEERLGAQIAALQAAEDEPEGMLQMAGAHRAQVARLEAESEQLARSAREKKRRIDELHAAREHGAFACPLCRTELGVAGIARIEESYKAEGTEESRSVRANREEAARLKGEADRLEDAAASLRRELAGKRARLTGLAGRMQAQTEQAAAAAGQVAKLRAHAADLEQRLASGAYAAEDRRRIAALEAEWGRLAYDREAHRTAERRVEQFAGYEERARQLDQAHARLGANRASLGAREAHLREARAHLGEVEGRLAQLDAAIAGQPDLRGRIEALDADVGTLGGRVTALHQALGGVEAQIESGRALAEERRRRAARLEELRREEGIYKDLVTAFGKNGVQALIIDAVLPEVEGEANRLLSGMTDGRMQVTLRTQRERAGGATETLEVAIADEWGTRDYSLYSGGEAFRINLALRIALSKLLARRAGAPLPTLVIDEGFGSQDAAGRERLIEAITAIQDDFECLLVVTHVEELKSLFDTRIEVTKDANGSVAQVVMA